MTEIASTGIRQEVSTSETRTLTVTSLGTLLVLAAFSAVATTISQTEASLGGGVSGVTWGLSGMSLGLAAVLLPVGALADDIGRRRVLGWSLLGLIAASALAAVAPGTAVFVVARMLQGGSGAGVLAASLAMIGQAFPHGERRTHATSVWGAALGSGIALGPLAGSLLAASLGWRSAYWLQALGAAALLPAVRRLPESRALRPRPVDVLSVLSLAGGMAGLTAGLVEGRVSWTSLSTLLLLGAGVLLLAVFATLQLRRRDPMVDLRLLREPTFLASVSGSLFTGVAIIGLMSYSPTLAQRGLGATGLGSAALLLTWSATSAVVALGARKLPAHIPAHIRLSAGLGLAALGEAGLTGLGTATSWGRLVPGFFVAGIGSGLANAALGRLAVESVPPERAGMGSGAGNTARYLGGAAGVAVVVVVVSAAGGTAGRRAALIHGWNLATLVCAALCLAGAVTAALCRARAAANVPEVS